MEVKEMSLLTYLCLDKANWHTALSDYYMFDMKNRTAKMLTDGGSPCAYAIFTNTGSDFIQLDYICSGPECRRNGYAVELLKTVLKQNGKEMRGSIVSSYPLFTELKGCLKKAGASFSEHSHVYSINIDDRLWTRMDEIRMTQMKELVLRDGAECVPFSEAGFDIKEQLFNSHYSSFGNVLNPALFRKDLHVAWDLSMAMVRNDRLSAYTLVTKIDEHQVCFEHISESKSMLGKGMIIAPICASMEAIKAIPKIKRMNLMITNDNKQSSDFVMSIFHDMEMTVTDNYGFALPAII